MALQGIPRDNGANFVGDYATIVSSSETDCDAMGPDGTVASGRFRHSFELYEGVPNSTSARRASLALVIEFHDEKNGSYRVGMEFPDLASMTKYVQEFNPCDRLPPDCRTPEAVGQVRERYQRRTQRFFNLVAERAGRAAPVRPPANPRG